MKQSRFDIFKENKDEKTGWNPIQLRRSIKKCDPWYHLKLKRKGYSYYGRLSSRTNIAIMHDGRLKMFAKKIDILRSKYYGYRR